MPFFSGGRVCKFHGEYREAHFVAVAFAEFAIAYRFEYQGQVGKFGHGVFPAECLVQQYVEGKGGQPFFAPDDVGDFHQVVIHDVGEVIGGHAVGFVEHFVVEERTVEMHFPANDVV